MRIFMMLAVAASLFLMGDAWAQSSWEKLIEEIDKPVMGKAPPADQNGSMALSMPEGFAVSSQQADNGQDDGVEAKVVTSYKCSNPSLPKCLIYLDDPDRVDVRNCKEVTKLYLRAVAGYSRCVDRQARKHARRVVDYFNCTTRGNKNCGFVYD